MDGQLGGQQRLPVNSVVDLRCSWWSFHGNWSHHVPSDSVKIKPLKSYVGMAMMASICIYQREIFVHVNKYICTVMCSWRHKFKYKMKHIQTINIHTQNYSLLCMHIRCTKSPYCFRIPLLLHWKLHQSWMINKKRSFVMAICSWSPTSAYSPVIFIWSRRKRLHTNTHSKTKNKHVPAKCSLIEEEVIPSFVHMFLCFYACHLESCVYKLNFFQA